MSSLSRHPRHEWVKLAAGSAGLLLFSIWAARVRGRHGISRRRARGHKRVGETTKPLRPPTVARRMSWMNMETLDLANHGLQHYPEQILYMAGSLKVLNLERNLISALSSAIGYLGLLTELNLKENILQIIPPEVGQLKMLRRLDLRGNLVFNLPSEVGHLHELEELYLTENMLTTFPKEMKTLCKLKKLHVCFNRLLKLPVEVATLPSLEMLRLSYNPELAELPSALGNSPTLCWISLAGTAMTAHPPQYDNHEPPFEEAHLELRESLLPVGPGTAGAAEIFGATYHGHDAIVKVFHEDEVAGEGQGSHEVEVMSAIGHHPNLTHILAVAREPALCVVMKRVVGRTLALEPSGDNPLRCRYKEGETFTADFIVRVASGVAGGLKHLHSKGICHGDVFAHNVIVDPEGHSTLCDYGSSFFYKPGGKIDFERLESRAYGLLLQDLVDRVAPMEGGDMPTSLAKVQAVKESCLHPAVQLRPTFAEVVAILSCASLSP